MKQKIFLWFFFAVLLLGCSLAVNAETKKSFRTKTILAADKLLSFFNEETGLQKKETGNQLFLVYTVDSLKKAFHSTGKKFYLDQAKKIASALKHDSVFFSAAENLFKDENSIELTETVNKFFKENDFKALSFEERIVLAKALQLENKKTFFLKELKNHLRIKKEVKALLKKNDLNFEEKIKLVHSLFFLNNTGFDNKLLELLAEKIYSFRSENGYWQRKLIITGDLNQEKKIDSMLLTCLSSVALYSYSPNKYGKEFNFVVKTFLEKQLDNGGWQNFFKQEGFELDSCGLLLLSLSKLGTMPLPVPVISTTSLKGTTPFKVDIVFEEPDKNSLEKQKSFAVLDDGNIFDTNTSKLRASIQNQLVKNLWVFSVYNENKRIGWFFLLNVSNSPPVPVLKASPVKGYPPLQVQFDASKSRDNEGKIKKYRLDYGDGNTENSFLSVHTYYKPGKYSARLLVEDETGNTSEKTIEIIVLEKKEVKPVEELKKMFPFIILAGVLVVIVWFLAGLMRKKFFVPVFFLFFSLVVFSSTAFFQSCQNVCENNDVYSLCCNGGTCNSDFVEDCGESESFSPQNFCDNNTLKERIVTIERGCNKGQCFENTSEQTQTIQECPSSYSCTGWQKSCDANKVVLKKTCTSTGCFDGSCTSKETIEEQVKEECPYSSNCQQPVLICKGKEVWSQQTCTVSGCFSGECSQQEQLNEELVKVCEEGCFQGSCVPNQQPEPVIEPSTETANAPALITFSGSNSSDADGKIVSYDWNFGDNTTASGEQVSHAYVNPGNYTVKLTVTDNYGGTNTTSFPITINGPIVSEEVNLGQISLDYYENDPKYMTVFVSCYPSNNTDAIKLYFYNSKGQPIQGYESDFAACNSQWLVGPFPNGVLMMVADYPVKAKCTACERRAYFAVLDPFRGLAIPDNSYYNTIILFVLVVFLMNFDGRRYKFNL